jgi:hypothetical protein
MASIISNYLNSNTEIHTYYILVSNATISSCVKLTSDFILLITSGSIKSLCTYQSSNLQYLPSQKTDTSGKTNI